MLGVATIATQAARQLTRKPAKGGELATWILLAAQLLQLASIIARAHEARSEASRAAQINAAIQAVHGRYRSVASTGIGPSSARGTGRTGTSHEEQRQQLAVRRRQDSERGYGR